MLFAVASSAYTSDTIPQPSKHAAHERIMFERLLDSWQRNGCAATQGLLIPEILELPRGLLTLLQRNLEFFQKLGFDLSPAGKMSVMVNGLPAGLRSSRPLTDLVVDMLNGLLDIASLRDYSLLRSKCLSRKCV